MVFIYTDAAKIPRAALAELRKAGIVPVRVTSFDEARFVDPEQPVSGNDLARIAVETIAARGWDATNTAFVKRLAKLLSEDSGTS